MTKASESRKAYPGADDGRRLIDPSCLRRLTDDELDVADEEGDLAGNQHYLDLRATSLADLSHALDWEAALIVQVRRSEDPAEAELAVYASRPPDDERESLWNMDLGVASASVALAVAGACPFTSCNGGTFGGVHDKARPQVRFYLQDAELDVLRDWAEKAGAWIEARDDALTLVAHDLDVLLGFARTAARAMESGRQS